MALSATALAGPVTAKDTVIRVVSGASVAVGNTLLVDHEVMVAIPGAPSPAFNVRRGLDGTIQGAHNTGAAVIAGLASDFAMPAPGQTSAYGGEAPDGQLGSGWTYATYAAAGAIAPVGGVHTINGIGVTAMTLAAPTLDQEGVTLIIESRNAAANTVVLGAVSGAAGPTGTFAATGGNVILKAAGGKWAVIGSNGVTFA
jgi:hypothetical protein